MAEVLVSGFDNSLRNRETSRVWTKWLAFVLGGALLTSAVTGTAQTTTSPRSAKKAPPQAEQQPTPAPQPMRSVPFQPMLPLMAPVQSPVVVWDGQFLTIDAENSLLSDVLLAIRARTGASIEMPGSASAERVALHIGPAPIREVLSSLLYGTNFNYLIQASEDDESGLGKVVLISRDGEVSDELTAGEVRADRNVRLMPGYAAPGKRDFQVAHERAMQEAADNGASAETPTPDSEPVATNDGVTITTSDPDAQPVASNSDSTTSSSAPSDTTLTATEQPMSGAGITSAGNTASVATDSSSISGMEQSLQKMYQQRRQMQAQQKQGPQTPPAP